MQPCACGVVHETDSGCPSLPLMQEVLSKSPVQQAAGNIESNEPVEADENKQTSTLIVFPGASRPVPEWRKQLSQRVREVQEQRAREAAEVAAAMQQAETVSCTLPSAQLELVPDREQPAMNPIVSKALERVDRARKSEFASTELAASTTAPALAPVSRPQTEPEQTTLPLAAPRTNLVVVPPSKAKSMRVMSDDLNGAALGYLEGLFFTKRPAWVAVPYRLLKLLLMAAVQPAGGTISLGTGVCGSRQEMKEPYMRANPPPATSMPLRGVSRPSSIVGSGVRTPMRCPANWSTDTAPVSRSSAVVRCT